MIWRVRRPGQRSPSRWSKVCGHGSSRRVFFSLSSRASVLSVFSSSSLSPTNPFHVSVCEWTILYTWPGREESYLLELSKAASNILFQMRETPTSELILGTSFSVFGSCQLQDLQLSETRVLISIFSGSFQCGNWGLTTVVREMIENNRNTRED